MLQAQFYAQNIHLLAALYDANKLPHCIYFNHLRQFNHLKHKPQNIIMLQVTVSKRPPRFWLNPKEDQVQFQK